MNASKKRSGVSLLLFALGMGALLACSDNEHSGNGVITETTNVASVRGLLQTASLEPAADIYVRIASADELPSAWEGVTIASDTTDSQGAWQIPQGLYPGEYEILATNGDSSLMAMAYFSVLADVDSIVTTTLTLSPPERLVVTFPDFADVSDTLAGGWLLRAVVRGLGAVVYLDTLGTAEFFPVPAGEHTVRVQRVDGIPGHETTLWEARLESLH